MKPVYKLLESLAEYAEREGRDGKLPYSVTGLCPCTHYLPDLSRNDKLRCRLYINRHMPGRYMIKGIGPYGWPKLCTAEPRLEWLKKEIERLKNTKNQYTKK